MTARLAVSLALAVMLAVMILAHAFALPRCEEDAVLIGAGSFDAGRWSAYVCGPAVDDYRL